MVVPMLKGFTSVIKNNNSTTFLVYVVLATKPNKHSSQDNHHSSWQHMNKQSITSVDAKHHGVSLSGWGNVRWVGNSILCSSVVLLDIPLNTLKALKCTLTGCSVLSSDIGCVFSSSTPEICVAIKNRNLHCN